MSPSDRSAPWLEIGEWTGQGTGKFDAVDVAVAVRGLDPFAPGPGMADHDVAGLRRRSFINTSFRVL